MPNIDLDRKETIKYEKSYVAFLDVLGFKNLVFSKKAEDKEKIELYFEVVNSAIKYLESIPSKKDIGSIVISDSIILSVPFGNSDEENLQHLRHLFVAVGLIQIGLALSDIWIRGAISSGDAYFDIKKNQVVGDAYINAYLLEESLAITPRIIIDNKIIQELKFKNAKEFIDKVNSERFNNWGECILYTWDDKHSDSIKLEKDIPLFIDYLDFTLYFKSEEHISTLIENIEKNMYHSTKLYKKFKWVTDYYISKLNSNDDNIKYTKRLLNL